MVPNPHPYVFYPPRSASIYVSHKFGSGSESFHYQAKIIRTSLISNVLYLLYDFLSLKNDVNVAVLGSNPHPSVFGPLGSESVSHKYGSGSGYFHNQAKTVKKP